MAGSSLHRALGLTDDEAVAIERLLERADLPVERSRVEEIGIRTDTPLVRRHGQRVLEGLACERVAAHRRRDVCARVEQERNEIAAAERLGAHRVQPEVVALAIDEPEPVMHLRHARSEACDDPLDRLGKEEASASRKRTISPRLAPKPAFRADPWPPFSFSTGTTLSPNEAMTSRDSSVEPSSTTITSTRGYVCASALMTASRRKRA